MQHQAKKQTPKQLPQPSMPLENRPAAAVSIPPPVAITQYPGANEIPGLEGVEQDMLIIPRLKLVQNMSVEAGDICPAGSLVNSMTKDVLAEKKKDIPATVIVQPILSDRNRILFAPIGEQGGIRCRSWDGRVGEGTPGGSCLTCPKNQWGKDGESPECTELLNVFVKIRGYNMPIPLVASFGRTSMGAGKQLINFFYMDSRRHQLPPWNFAYELGTELIKNDKGQYFVFKVKPAGKAEPHEVEEAAQFYDMIKLVGSVRVHEDEEEIKQERARMADSQNVVKEAEADDKVPF